MGPWKEGIWGRPSPGRRVVMCPLPTRGCPTRGLGFLPRSRDQGSQLSQVGKGGVIGRRVLEPSWARGPVRAMHSGPGTSRRPRGPCGARALGLMGLGGGRR